MRIPSAARVGLVLAVLLAAAGLTLWRAAPLRVDPGRDVILILVDTLRADHVGIYAPQGTSVTPHIDWLARRGRWFEQAWSQAPWTPPSVMSLMTSLEPAVHGLELEGQSYAAMVPALPAGARTLAQDLAQAGYQTLAVTAGGGVGSGFGFRRGFECFYEPRPTPPEDVRAGVDRALAWLGEADARRPLFLFFHTYEVHGPNTHGAPSSASDPAARARADYDADLAFADGEIGRLIAELESRWPHRRRLIVLTADHGENLYDRVLGGRVVEHGHHLFPELLQVPLLFVAPGLLPPGGALSGPVQLIDVKPTVLSLLGLPIDRRANQGRDLRGLLQGWAAVDAQRRLYAAAPLQGPGWHVLRTPTLTFMQTPRVAGANWWNSVELPPVALYDRSSDASERSNLAPAGPDLVARWSRELERHRQDNVSLRRALGEGGAVLPGESAETLRGLGYIDAAP